MCLDLLCVEFLFHIVSALRGPRPGKHYIVVNQPEDIPAQIQYLEVRFRSSRLVEYRCLDQLFVEG